MKYKPVLSKYSVAFFTRSRCPKLTTSFRSGMGLFTRSQKPFLFNEHNIYIPKRNKVTWVAASHLYNYLIKDPLIDWIKIGKKGRKTNHDSFLKFLMNRGREFESEVVKYIHEHKIPVVSVSDVYSAEGVKKTISYMKEGHPVIHSAPIRNTKNNTHGVIDLLVRSDYLNQLIDEPVYRINKQHIPAPKLKLPFHYVVIDIKFSTLPLRSDGIHVLNSRKYPAYKGQIWVYNQAIGNIQGYTPRYGFLLGRRWRYISKGITYTNNTCTNKLGVIDFGSLDKEYNDLSIKAIDWVRDVKNNGKRWSINPPSRNELYPNMCIDSGMYNNQKKKIAKKLGDITMIWQCGTKHRNIGFKNGVRSWKDENCNKKTIGMTGNLWGYCK